jgi:small subunit ribosomal protein S1
MELKNIREGMTVNGTVYQVKDSEVIVTIPHSPLEGTITLDHLSRRPLSSAKEVVQVGDNIEAEVIKKTDEILLLSCLPIEERKTFDALQEVFNDDRSVEGVVVRAVKGGLIVKVDGFDCFMPASEASDTYTENLEVFVGQTLKVRVIEIKRNKVVVSHKQVIKDAAKEAKAEELENIKVGDVLEGTVAKILDFGAFIRFNQAEGLLHISQISHHNVKHVSDVLSEGQTVKVKVIEAKSNKRSLSMKALEPTPWQQFAQAHKVGDTVQGTIVKKMKFGMLVEVARDVAGMLNKLDYSWDPRFNLAGNVDVGQAIEVKILSIDVKQGKMQLSKKHLEYNPWDDVKVKIGEGISGTVKAYQDNGAIVEVQGVQAYLPIGEIQEQRVERVQDALKLEQVINATVLKFNPKEWQMVISKKEYEERAVREEYKKYLKTETKEDQSQTLGELFAEKFKELKK